MPWHSIIAPKFYIRLLHTLHTSVHLIWQKEPHKTHLWLSAFELLVCHSLMEGTHTQQQPFYGPLSGTTRVSRYQKKHSPTHHPDHHPVFISFFHLPRSIASSLFKLRAWQFLHNLFPCPLWSTSWSGAIHLIFRTFLHPRHRTEIN